MTAPGRPVVFIHGLWLHSSSWQPWIELFEQAGYSATAPEWPGVADTADKGIDDVVDHYVALIKDLPSKPILVGHSFGGMIAEKMLGMDTASAAIAIDAAQIKGVLPLPLSSLRSTLPVFKNPTNKHKAVSLTKEQFRYSFGNTLPEEESDRIFEAWTIPAPGKPLFEAAAANFSLHSPAQVDTRNDHRGPLLLISGGEDHTVPEVITKSTLKQYRDSQSVTELKEFADRGHSLVVDSGWKDVAQACLEWLTSQGLGPDS